MSSKHAHAKRRGHGTQVFWYVVVFELWDTLNFETAWRISPVKTNAATNTKHRNAERVLQTQLLRMIERAGMTR